MEYIKEPLATEVMAGEKGNVEWIAEQEYYNANVGWLTSCRMRKVVSKRFLVFLPLFPTLKSNIVGSITLQGFDYRLPHIEEKFLEVDTDVYGNFVYLSLGRR